MSINTLHKGDDDDDDDNNNNNNNNNNNFYFTVNTALLMTMSVRRFIYGNILRPYYGHPQAFH